MMAMYLSQERADFLKGGFVSINWDIMEMEANKEEIVEKQLLKMQWLPAKLGETSIWSLGVKTSGMVSLVVLLKPCGNPESINEALSPIILHPVPKQQVLPHPGQPFG